MSERDEPTGRYEPPPLDELVDDVSPELRAELERVDTLLRSVPAPPPALPPGLRHGPPATPGRAGIWAPRRLAVALVAAAVLAASFFGLGRWVAADGFETRAAVSMHATDNALGASGVIRLGKADAAGNRTVRLEVRGLPQLPEGGYYVLWLAKGREYAATCGTFAVGAGETTAEWTASYSFGDYDAWVVTARLPGDRTSEAPWLLEAEI
jgi:hypothetical protein